MSLATFRFVSYFLEPQVLLTLGVWLSPPPFLCVAIYVYFCRPFSESLFGSLAMCCLSAIGCTQIVQVPVTLGMCLLKYVC